MPFNASGQSFQPQNTLALNSPAVLSPSLAYSNLTTAQCAANGALTSVSVTSSGATVEATKARTNGITIIVPSDQTQVTFASQPVTATNPLAAVSQITTFAEQVAASGAAPSSNGFALSPGQAVWLAPYNDAMYAVTPTGLSATIYFIDNAAGGTP